MAWIKSIYTGLISGLVLSLALGHSLWLEMRVNTALALPLCLAGGIWAGCFFKNRLSPGMMVLMQGVLGMVFLYLYGPDAGALAVVPASIVREGLFLNFADLSWINSLLAGLIVLGNLSFFPFTHVLKDTEPL